MEFTAHKLPYTFGFAYGKEFIGKISTYESTP